MSCFVGPLIYLCCADEVIKAMGRGYWGYKHIAKPMESLCDAYYLKADTTNRGWDDGALQVRSKPQNLLLSLSIFARSASALGFALVAYLRRSGLIG
jgi:hypothetical protein